MYKQNSCVITGSFDPFTKGHLSLVEKSLEYFEQVYILIAVNPNKKYMFTNHERLAIIEDALGKYEFKDRVIVTEWHGSVVDFCISSKVYTIVRGIRDVNDMAYELNMAHTNRMLGNDKYDLIIDTIFIPSYDNDMNISSSLVRMFINMNDDVWGKYVPNHGFIKQILELRPR